MRTKWLTFHDRKWLTLKRPLTKAKRERKGRNPHTGKSMAIKARKVVTFKTSPVLKKEMNG